VAAVIAAALQSQESQAVGFRLPNQDPEAIARGNAFAATADNPSAIYYNPAGITQLEGQQARAGVYAISTGVDYTSPTGATAHPDSTFQPVPQLYYVNSPKDSEFSFGVGFYSPYGLAIDWGKDNPFRTRAEEGELMYLTLNPVIAWQILPSLSIAVGPQISYSKATFKQGIFIPGDEFSFKGDDIGYSFNAGVLWKPIDELSFGLNYRYLTTMDYHGHSETNPETLPAPLPPVLAPAYFGSTPTSASIRFPQSISGGVSYRPTKNWNIEFDADWTDWDDLNEIELKGPGLPPITLNYKSSWMYEFGVTRTLPDNWFVSTGYIYSENSSPSAGFNPLIPDSNLHLGSIGFGRHGVRWDWALAYHFGYNGGREVSGSAPSVAGETADGTYKVFNHAVNLAATLKF
jgi:long-chain fatty acid transport protein